MTEEELHDAVRVDPERAWPIVLAFVRDNPGSAAAQDFVEDFIYEHDLAFMARIREAALNDPHFRDVVAQCHIGGFATAGADAFNRLQADIREDAELRMQWETWSRRRYPAPDYPPGSESGPVAGVDLALVDGDGAAILACHFDDRLEPPDDLDRLNSATIESLERVMPHLSPAGRDYFGPLLDLLRSRTRREVR